MYAFEKNKISTPFQVPQDYFASFSKRCLDRIEHADLSTLESIDMVDSSPKISVPNGYFEKMQQSVVAQISQGTDLSIEKDLINNHTYSAPKGYLQKDLNIKQPQKAIPLYSNSSILRNIAATFLLLVVMGYLFIKPTSTSSSQNNSKNEEIEMAAWENYLETETDVHMEQGTDPIVNLEYISDKEVTDFLQEEEEYLDIF